MKKEDEKFANRIPFENVQEGEVVKPWALPSLPVKKPRKVFTARHAKAPARPGEGEVIEDYSGPIKPKPITAKELQQLAEEAQREGYDKGYAEGLAQGRGDGLAQGKKEGHEAAYKDTKSKLDQQVGTFFSLAQKLLQPMEQQEAALEKVLVDMAVHFAGVLLAREIDRVPQSMVALIKNALQCLPAGARNISVILNPEDALLVEELLPAQQRNWQILRDASIARGGCRIETLESLVDYTCEARLQKFLAHVALDANVTADAVPPVQDIAVEDEQASVATDDAAPDTDDAVFFVAADDSDDENEDDVSLGSDDETPTP